MLEMNFLGSMRRRVQIPGECQCEKKKCLCSQWRDARFANTLAQKAIVDALNRAILEGYEHLSRRLMQ